MNNDIVIRGQHYYRSESNIWMARTEWTSVQVGEYEASLLDEIERLYRVVDGLDGMCELFVAKVAAKDSKIELLCASGDAIAKSLAEFNDPEDEIRLLTWREARRG